MTEWTPANGRPMSRISRRLWGAVGSRILESGALDDMLARPGLAADAAARLSEYERRAAYYANNGLYQYLHKAGLCRTAVPTEWNPVPLIVAFYVANVLGGKLTVQPKDENADSDALQAAVEQVWEWSNFQTLRGKLTETAGVFSDVFVKVAEKRKAGKGADEGDVTAVYMQDIDPRSVVWWEADERDFLTGIRIDTPRLTSIFTGEERRHTLVEVWRKDWGGDVGGVAFYEVQPGSTVEDGRLGEAIRWQSFDDLGYDFIPIVWTRVETHWRRALDEIDLYNLKAWKADRLNRPLWLVKSNTLDAMGRAKPAPRIDTDALQATYADVGEGAVGILYMPGMSDLESPGSPADLVTMHNRLVMLYESIIDSLPEYRVTTLKASTQIAKETLELLLEQASQRVLAMREDLERGLVRAQMMALSIAQVAGVKPELFAPERIGAYEDGRTDHIFTPRGVFGKSAAAKVEELVKLTAAGATLEGAAEVAGYTDHESEALVNLSTAVFPEEGQRVGRRTTNGTGAGQ